VGLGEPPVNIQAVPNGYAWLVLLGEDLTHEFSSAAHTDLVEDGLEVVPHGVGRDVQLLGDFSRGQPAQDGPQFSGSRWVPCLG
jgi:hypothetical protein